MADRRLSRRVSITADVIYQPDDVALTKRIADISEGGVFIDTPVPAQVGASLHLRFAIENVEISARGRVAFSQPYIGMGVEFEAISPESVIAIRRYVAAAAEPVGAV